jgi:hypothetical protein
MEDNLSQTWTEEELDDLFDIEPLTGHEIIERGLTGSWVEDGADPNIDASVEWVNRVKKNEQDRFKW